MPVSPINSQNSLQGRDLFCIWTPKHLSRLLNLTPAWKSQSCWRSVNCFQCSTSSPLRCLHFRVSNLAIAAFAPNKNTLLFCMIVSWLIILKCTESLFLGFLIWANSQYHPFPSLPVSNLSLSSSVHLFYLNFFFPWHNCFPHSHVGI